MRSLFNCRIRAAVVVALGIFVVPGALPARTSEEPINIGAEDVREREIELMKQTKQQLARTARALRKEATADAKVLNSAAYAASYRKFQEELSRARRRVWWNRAPEVSIPEVPQPTSAAVQALAQTEAEETRREEAQRSAAARQSAELRLEAERLRAEQALVVEEQRQTRELARRNALLHEIYENNRYVPYYGAYIAPRPVVVPHHIKKSAIKRSPGKKAHITPKP